MAPTVVLITGANRGLGFNLAKRFLAKPDHVLVAAVRDPSHATVENLISLPIAEGTRLVVVKYDAAVEQSPFDAVSSIRDSHGIDHLDIVLANAAVAKVFPLAKDARRADIEEHFAVNVLSIVSLYQATRDLLQKAASSPEAGGRKPVFAIMGSTSGSLGRQFAVPNSAYGPSKSMAHWYGVRINAEDEWLSVPIIDPGWVQTDMGNSGAKSVGLDSAPTTIEDSCNGVFAVLTDPDSKAKFGGKMVSYTGEIQEW